MSTVGRAFRHPGTWVGLLGALLLLAGGYAATTLAPAYTQLPGAGLWYAHMRGRGRHLQLLGALILMGAFLWLRPSKRRKQMSAWVPFLLWTVPLLAAPPVISASTYSFLDFTFMAHNGHVMTQENIGTTDSPWASYVLASWQGLALNSPGPLLKIYSLAQSVGGGPIAAVFLLRLLAFLGAVLTGLGVQDLAHRLGAPRQTALWLALLNPVMVVACVGHPQPSTLGVGLGIVAAALAYRRRGWITGAVVAGVAGWLCYPALIIAILGALVATRSASWRSRLLHLAGSVAIAGGVFLAGNVATHALRGGVRGFWARSHADTYSPLSLLHRTIRETFHQNGVVDQTSAQAMLLSAFIILAFIAAWLLRHRWEQPWLVVTAIVCAYVVLNPTLYEWFLALPLALLAVCHLPRVVRALVAGLIAYVMLASLALSLYSTSPALGVAYLALDAGIILAWVWIYRGRVRDALRLPDQQPHAVPEGMVVAPEDLEYDHDPATGEIEAVRA